MDLAVDLYGPSVRESDHLETSGLSLCRCGYFERGYFQVEKEFVHLRVGEPC